MPRDRGKCGIIERRALQPAVVEDKAERLDQIDRHAKARRQAEQRPSILRNVRLIQREAQWRFPLRLKKGVAGDVGDGRIVLRSLPIYAAVCRIVRLLQRYSLRFPRPSEGRRAPREVLHVGCGAIASFPWSWS